MIRETGAETVIYATWAFRPGCGKLQEIGTDAEELLTQWYETGDTDLPENVLYQSLFPQGSGTYLVSDWGQYFCYQ